MCVFFLDICLFKRKDACSPQGPEEGVVSFGTGVNSLQVSLWVLRIKYIHMYHTHTHTHTHTRQV